LSRRANARGPVGIVLTESVALILAVFAYHISSGWEPCLNLSLDPFSVFHRTPLAMGIFVLKRAMDLFFNIP
jgi:hypothetical protein